MFKFFIYWCVKVPGTASHLIGIHHVSLVFAHKIVLLDIIGTTLITNVLEGTAWLWHVIIINLVLRIVYGWHHRLLDINKLTHASRCNHWVLTKLI